MKKHIITAVILGVMFSVIYYILHNTDKFPRAEIVVVAVAVVVIVATILRFVVSKYFMKVNKITKNTDIESAFFVNDFNTKPI